ncbi:hypothetical protein AB0O01_10425 [Streptomyces sp. NPDC093252]
MTGPSRTGFRPPTDTDLPPFLTGVCTQDQRPAEQLNTLTW